MHPLIGASQNTGKLSKSTEWAVEVGTKSEYEIKRKWQTEYSARFSWVDSDQVSCQVYGNFNPGSQPLWVKCDFMKVYNCVLMVFQPMGRFVNHPQLKEQVQLWIGNTYGSAITNSENFRNNQIWSNIKKNGAETIVTTFPYGAKFAISVANNFERERFIEEANQWLAKKDISWITFKQGHLTTYSEKVREIENTNMYVNKTSALINGFVVTFFHNSSELGDRQLLKDEARSWFPNAQRFIQQEDLDKLLPMLLNPGFEATAYKDLVEKLKEQPIPSIDLSSLAAGEIPDMMVSSDILEDESKLEGYFQVRDPKFISPQKILRDQYLIPKIVHLNEIFSAIKIKMDASQNEVFKSNFGQVSISASKCGKRKMINFYDEENGDQIRFLGSHTVAKRMHIYAYSGNLRHLNDMIEGVIKNWDIDKFIESADAL